MPQPTSPTPSKSSAAVVQSQLGTYNAKDVEALSATCAPEANQITLHGERLAKVHASVRKGFLQRSAEPDLHVRLLPCGVVWDMATGVRLVSRDFPRVWAPWSRFGSVRFTTA
jgi:hypothetical protein